MLQPRCRYQPETRGARHRCVPRPPSTFRLTLNQQGPVNWVWELKWEGRWAAPAGSHKVGGSRMPRQGALAPSPSSRRALGLAERLVLVPLREEAKRSGRGRARKDDQEVGTELRGGGDHLCSLSVPAVATQGFPTSTAQPVTVLPFWTWPLVVPVRVLATSRCKRTPPLSPGHGGSPGCAPQGGHGKQLHGSSGVV